MRTGDNRVASVIELYRSELGPLFGAGETRAITRAVFHHQLGWDAADMELHKRAALSESELLKVYLPLQRIRSGEPLQYVLGQVPFMGLAIGVSPGVLIPRPETEEMVDRIRTAANTPSRIVDIGTGSGCIALALKHHFRSAEVFGVDVSSVALSVARRNAERNSLDVKFMEGDVLAPTFNIPRADLIVSNPPYIPRSEEQGLSAQVREHEPHLALFVDDHDPLLFHRTIAGKALDALSAGGVLWFEAHYRHAAAVADLLLAMGYREVVLENDLSGNPRMIHCRR